MAAVLLSALVLAATAGLVLGGCASSLGGAGAKDPDKDGPRDMFGRPVDPPGEGPVAPSFEPIVLERADGKTVEDPEQRERRDLDPEDAGWAEKLDLVRGLMEAGEDEQALTVIDAALAQSPPTTWASRLRNQRLEIKARRTEQQVVRLDARPTKDVVSFATEVEFRIRIRNMGAEEVVFGAPASETTAAGRALPGAGGGSANAITLEVVRRDRDVSAVLLERRWTTNVYLQRPGDPPLRIGPGQTRELPVRIPAEDVGAPIAGVRVIEVYGTLRPSHMTVGGVPGLVPLSVRRGRVAVLPEGHEPLAAEPLKGLEQAVLLGAAAHVLVAMEFLPRGRAPQAAMLLARALSEGDPLLVTAAQGALAMLRERCVGDPLAPLVEPLLASLESRPERSRELIGGLMALTDVRLAADARLWEDWGRRTRGTRAVVTAPAAGPGPTSDAAGRTR